MRPPGRASRPPRARTTRHACRAGTRAREGDAARVAATIAGVPFPATRARVALPHDRRHDGQDRLALQAARLRLPVLRDLRRARLVVRLRPLRRPAQGQRQGALAGGDGAGARRHRRARLGDHPAPAGLGGLRPRRRASPTRSSTASTCKQRFRADHLDDAQCGQQAEQAARRDAGLRPHRGAPVQPDVRDARRRRSRRPAPTVYLRPETAQGIFVNFKNVAAARAAEAAVRHRADRQVVPQRDHARATSSSARASSSRWRWSSSSRRPRPTSGSSYWIDERIALVPRATASATEPPAPARRTTPTSSRTTRAARATSSTCSRSAGRSSRASRTAATSTSRRTRSASGKKLEYVDAGRGERYVPHVIEPAAGVDRVDARVPRRRLRRGGRRRARAHRAAPPPAARAGEGRGPAADRARTTGMAERARGALRGAAPRVMSSSTTTAGRSAAATAARTRSARRGRSRSTTRRSRTRRSRSATATRSRRSGSRSPASGPGSTRARPAVELAQGRRGRLRLTGGARTAPSAARPGEADLRVEGVRVARVEDPASSGVRAPFDDLRTSSTPRPRPRHSSSTYTSAR